MLCEVSYDRHIRLIGRVEFAVKPTNISSTKTEPCNRSRAVYCLAIQSDHGESWLVLFGTGCQISLVPVGQILNERLWPDAFDRVSKSFQ